MMEKVLTIRNRLGLHARPAALLAQTAGRYQSAVRVLKDDLEVNGKSVMGLMMLAAECGSKLRILVEGTDEGQALAEIETLFNKNFDED
jgi:phosphocarrier protein HPr